MVRERVAIAKIELEIRLRIQIEQEMKDEMEAMQKREVFLYIGRTFCTLFKKKFNN